MQRIVDRAAEGKSLWQAAMSQKLTATLFAWNDGWCGARNGIAPSRFGDNSCGRSGPGMNSAAASQTGKALASELFTPSSEADEIGDWLAVLAGGAEEEVAGEGSLDPEVVVVFPGVGDAAEELDALRGDEALAVA